MEALAALMVLVAHCLCVRRLKVKVEAIWRDEKEVQMSQSGENLRIRVTGAEETDVSAGFVLSSIKSPVPCVTQFEAQLMIVELLEHNPVFTVGFTHSVVLGLMGRFAVG